MLSAALLAGGCGQSPQQAHKVVVAEADPLDRAREAMNRGDYGTAVRLLREALTLRPTDLETHYRLAVSASHLEQSDEASREFEWIMAHGEPGAAEVQIARDWLASRTPGGAPPLSVSSTGGPEQAPKPEMASLTGRAVGPEGLKPRLQLFLKGLPGTSVTDQYHVLRTDQQGNFHFTDVVPGDYMLSNVIAGPPAWRLRVSLAKGERLVLNLSPANHATVRDDFPGS
jgi:hypothetical protein